MASVQLFDSTGQVIRTQTRPTVDELRNQADARLQKVTEEVQRFFERNDDDKMLRFFVAAEFVAAWLEQGLGKQIERHFNLEDVLERIIEAKYNETR